MYTEYVEDTLAPLVKGVLPDNELDPISLKNEALQAALLKHFERDGEQLYHRCQFLPLLFLLQMQISQYSFEGDLGMFCKLQRARLSFIID